MIGGTTFKGTIDLDETAFAVASGAGFLTGMFLYNNAAAVRFVRLYDKATAPTEADTPIGGCTFPLPANGGGVVPIGGGISYSLGLWARATTGVAYNNTGAPSANDVIANFW